MKLNLMKKLSNDDYLKLTSQFTYVYQDVQADFIEKLVKNSKIKTSDM